jgi:hypothetical protein
VASFQAKLVFSLGMLLASIVFELGYFSSFTSFQARLLFWLIYF